MFDSLFTTLSDSRLPKRARKTMRKARRVSARRVKAAADKPSIWRSQVRSEESMFLSILAIQLRHETR